jgi:hypothetical protein
MNAVVRRPSMTSRTVRHGLLWVPLPLQKLYYSLRIWRLPFWRFLKRGKFGDDVTYSLEFAVARWSRTTFPNSLPARLPLLTTFAPRSIPLRILTYRQVRSKLGVFFARKENEEKIKSNSSGPLPRCSPAFLRYTQPEERVRVHLSDWFLLLLQSQVRLFACINSFYRYSN